MRSRLTLAAALALSLAVGACSDDPPTSANNAAPEGQQTTPDLKPERASLLTNVPVTGVADVIATPVVEANPFSGTLTVTRFDYDQATGRLLVSGTITDAATGKSDTFERQPATLVRQGAPTSPVCDILILDLGPLELDLLGLIVDLSPVHLEIRAETGPGNLLGNLLCALVGLLDPQPALGSPLQIAITNLLNTINQLLQALL
jgi:hypothetical protein